MTVMANAEIASSRILLNEAIKEDPEFFMAHFILAFNNLVRGNLEMFKTHSEKALNSRAPLGKGELLIKIALKQLYENPKTDVTETGEKLTEFFPGMKWLTTSSVLKQMAPKMQTKKKPYYNLKIPLKEHLFRFVLHKTFFVSTFNFEPKSFI